jgi:hypothetical protein
MSNLKINHIPKGRGNRPGHPMTPKGVLYHTTNNWADGAGDEAHANYVNGVKTEVSWHETVDKDSVTQHLPHNESAYHAGDGGNGYYNRNYIGIEIACEAVAPGQPLDKATYDNAVERVAELCVQYGFDKNTIAPHKVVYGKDCPHHTLFNHDKFENDVMAKVAELKGSKPAQHTPVAGDGYLHVVVSGDTLIGIAKRYGKTADYLAKLNEIPDPSKIYVGQRLKLQGTIPTAPAPAAPKPSAVTPPTGTGIKQVGTIQIVGVKAAAFICDRPSGNSNNLGTIKLHAKIAIAGSVPGWWEVIYNGRRAYINAKYGKRV